MQVFHHLINFGAMPDRKKTESVNGRTTYRTVQKEDADGI